MSFETTNLLELLRLAFQKPVTWLAGDPILPGQVSWVTTTIADAHPGDLLILLPQSWEEDTLRRAQQQKVAALILLGEMPSMQIVAPPGLNLAVVPGETDLRRAQQALLIYLVNQRSGRLERAYAIFTSLSQIAVEGSGLEGLARAMSDLCGCGVLVQDKRLQVLAGCPTPGLADIWDEISEHFSSSGNLPEPLHDRKTAGRQAIILSQSTGGAQRLITPIRTGEVARGYLSLIRIQGRMDILDHLVAEQGALVCAIEMYRSKTVRETEKRLKGYLLNALLQEDLSARDVQLWVQSMDIDFEQVHVALRFAWEGGSPPSRRRLETLVNGEISRLGLRAFVSSLGAEVICFCPAALAAGRPERALALGQAVIRQGALEAPANPVRCGIGTPSNHIGEWQISFRQAGQALEMARRLGNDRPSYFPDLSVYRLLLQIEHNPELVALQEEMLGALFAYEGGQELIHTLEAFFEHNGNLSQTAEALHVHRNTLIYRLDRIREITHHSLDLPDIRLAVQLSLYIARMRGMI